MNTSTSTHLELIYLQSAKAKRSQITTLTLNTIPGRHDDCEEQQLYAAQRVVSFYMSTEGLLQGKLA